MDIGAGRIRRVIVLVIDGLGVGAMPDVADVRPRDVGADTLGHVVKAAGTLSLPNLERMGLGTIAPGSDAALIGQLGLRSGDVVTSINGAPVDSIARGQQILESLRSASNARVTVLRDGKPTDVVISLK